MRGTIPPLPQYVFMAWCLVKHRDKFTFYLYISSSSRPALTLPILTRPKLYMNAMMI
jgi:hypothetical protein